VPGARASLFHGKKGEGGSRSGLGVGHGGRCLSSFKGVAGGFKPRLCKADARKWDPGIQGQTLLDKSILGGGD